MLGFRQAVEAHAAQDLGGLRELDVSVVDDLDLVPPRVEEVEAASRLGFDARRLECLARRLLVVDDETEVAAPIRACVLPSESAMNWSPISMNAIRAERPRSSRSKIRP